jgi:hypothetical protein
MVHAAGFDGDGVGIDIDLPRLGKRRAAGVVMDPLHHRVEVTRDPAQLREEFQRRARLAPVPQYRS